MQNVYRGFISESGEPQQQQQQGGSQTQTTDPEKLKQYQKELAEWQQRNNRQGQTTEGALSNPLSPGFPSFETWSSQQQQQQQRGIQQQVPKTRTIRIENQPPVGVKKRSGFNYGSFDATVQDGGGDALYPAMYYNFPGNEVQTLPNGWTLRRIDEDIDKKVKSLSGQMDAGTGVNAEGAIQSALNSNAFEGMSPNDNRTAVVYPRREVLRKNSWLQRVFMGQDSPKPIGDLTVLPQQGSDPKVPEFLDRVNGILMPKVIANDPELALAYIQNSPYAVRTAGDTKKAADELGSAITRAAQRNPDLIPELIRLGIWDEGEAEVTGSGNIVGGEQQTQTPKFLQKK